MVIAGRGGGGSSCSKESEEGTEAAEVARLGGAAARDLGKSGRMMGSGGGAGQLEVAS